MNMNNSQPSTKNEALNSNSSGTSKSKNSDELVGLTDALAIDPKKILHEPTLDGIKRYIQNKNDKLNIIVLAGAGISTSAGIPDFRSPESGLYAKIQKEYKLNDPQQIFEIGYFKNNPKAFYTLAKDLLPKGFSPTPAHHFVKLLHNKGLLLRLYTQNVDSLERKAGIPDDKIVEAHGSFYLSHCLSCQQEFSFDWVKEKIYEGIVPKCTNCDGIVKPDIIFFGESLPPRFFHLASQDFPKCDLLIIMGTSLVVQPFASLVDKVKPHCPRVLINREKVCSHSEDSFLVKLLKRFSSEKEFDGTSEAFGALLGKEGFNFEDCTNKDVALIGDCDQQVIKFAEALGWTSELDQLLQGEK